MREGLSGTAGDDLSFHALLYASGELEGEELAAFEKRLALDQAARDALAQAVELSLTMEGKADQGPEPEVRARIRQRLRQRRRNRFSDSLSSGFVGHPAVWSLIGALVTLVLLMILSQVVALYEADKPPAPKAAPTKSDLEAKRALLEAQALGIAAQLGNAPDRPALEAQLMELSRQLVSIDMALQVLRVKQLEKEIQQLKQALADPGGKQDERVKQRYEGIVNRPR